MANFTLHLDIENVQKSLRKYFGENNSNYTKTMLCGSVCWEKIYCLCIFRRPYLVHRIYTISFWSCPYGVVGVSNHIYWLLIFICHILFQENSTEPDSTPVSPDAKVEEPHSFQKMVEVLPSKLSKTMASNLSVPIAFVCLLHLANEKVND